MGLGSVPGTSVGRNLQKCLNFLSSNKWSWKYCLSTKGKYNFLKLKVGTSVYIGFFISNIIV